MSDNELLKNVTPIPWEHKDNCLLGNDTRLIACNILDEDKEHAIESKANFDLIVKAVNNYETLLEVCEQALDYVNLMLQSSDEDSGEGELSYRLQKAIERAKGGNL